jgi:hypothetical protein
MVTHAAWLLSCLGSFCVHVNNSPCGDGKAVQGRTPSAVRVWESLCLSHSLVTDSFAIYGMLCWCLQHPPPRHCHLSLPGFLSNSTYILWGKRVPCTRQVRKSEVLLCCFESFWLLTVWYNVAWYILSWIFTLLGVLWADWDCLSFSFLRFGEFQVFFLNKPFGPFFPLFLEIPHFV